MHPVLFLIGATPIYTYGVLVAAGWLLGIGYWLRQVPHMALRGGEREAWHLVYAAVAGALVGGKLLALVDYSSASTLREMLWNFRSGFVYLGGVLGAWLSFSLLCRVKGYRALPKGDFVAGPIALGHAIGRLGCLAAGCCHGAPTTLPWGIRFTDPRAAVPRELLGVPLHPTQLLEVTGEFAIFAVLHLVFQPRLVAARIRPGMTWLSYVLMYGVLRFTVDFWRGDDPDFVVGPLTASQAMSLALVAGTLLFMRRLHRAPAGPGRTGA
jgi:phosphatidylglycerol---prolipoprotein diacylglyceryl transferase